MASIHIMLSSTMRKLFSTILSVLCYMTLSAASRIVKGIVLDPGATTTKMFSSSSSRTRNQCLRL